MEGIQRGALDMEGLFFIEPGQAGACFGEDIHDGKIGLERCGVQSVQIQAAENGTGHQEIGGGAPVAFNGQIGRFDLLVPFDLEGYLGAMAPVLRLQEDIVPFHLALDADAEFPQHVHRNEHVGNALGIFHVEGGILAGEREGGQQAGNEL